ncbi:MAG: 50S ribosomal protein L11 methyltransferase [Deltaproteobacteria bacterium]|nr:50S ribosomal protein L11 methyltransferase [Deltaproteobacteria bacterium]
MEYRLCVKCDPDWTDVVGNRFFEIGMRGLEIATETPIAELNSYCDSEDSARAYAEAIAGYLRSLAALWPDATAWSVDVAPLAGVDWANEWKKYFKPVRISERIVVRPSWETYDATGDDLVIVIDPKMAFGTGGHETTTLALRALERLRDEGVIDAATPVIDIGTGTGILAIAAVMLGAPRAFGVDTDPVAIECAVENAGLNGVSERAAFVVGGADAISEAFRVVVANIDAPTLGAIAPAVADRVEPGGRLALTGLLEAGANEIESRFVAMGFLPRRRDALGEWRLIELERAK